MMDLLLGATVRGILYTRVRGFVKGLSGEGVLLAVAHVLLYWDIRSRWCCGLRAISKL